MGRIEVPVAAIFVVVGIAIGMVLVGRLPFSVDAAVNVIGGGVMAIAGGYVGALIQAGATRAAAAQQAAEAERSGRVQYIGSLDLYSRRALGLYARIRRALEKGLPDLAKELFGHLTSELAAVDVVAHQDSEDAALIAAADAFLELDGMLYDQTAEGFRTGNTRHVLNGIDAYYDRLTGLRRNLQAAASAWVAKSAR